MKLEDFKEIQCLIYCLIYEGLHKEYPIDYIRDSPFIKLFNIIPEEKHKDLMIYLIDNHKYLLEERGIQGDSLVTMVQLLIKPLKQIKDTEIDLYIFEAFNKANKYIPLHIVSNFADRCSVFDEIKNFDDFLSTRNDKEKQDIGMFILLEQMNEINYPNYDYCLRIIKSCNITCFRDLYKAALKEEAKCWEDFYYNLMIAPKASSEHQ